jgi:thiamine-phosphate pyrophosphorylase
MSAPSDLGRRLRLTVVADPEGVRDRSLLDAVRSALAAGAPAVQLRAKHLTARETVELGARILAETSRSGALFFVNDRLDLALATGADGAHLGQDDLPMAAARRIAPAGFLLGGSAETVEQARAMERDGADYLGVGTVYATRSKLDAGAPIGVEGVRAAVAAVGIPVVGIGGIDADNAAAVVGAGAAGVALISAVLAAPDPGEAVRALLRAIERGAAGPGA